MPLVIKKRLNSVFSEVAIVFLKVLEIPFIEIRIIEYFIHVMIVIDFQLPIQYNVKVCNKCNI